MSNVFLDTHGKEYLKPKSVATEWRIGAYAVIENDHGEILTVIPTWNTLHELPGGGIEPDESITQGLLREVYEETGYRAEIINPIPATAIHEENWFHLHKKKYYHSLILAYLCRLKSTKQNLKIINTQDGNEITKILWVPKTSFNKRNTHRIAYGLLKALI